MDDQEQILAKIQKLLRVAEGKANEHESAAALQMAQRLADAYNIDIAGVGGTKEAGARDEQVFPGGLYPYQRRLYNEIAKLNHCLYWFIRGTGRGQKYQHRMVGSQVNVMLAKQMGEYLQGAVEAITRQEHCGGDARQFFTKDAHWFREGMIDRIIGTIWEKRDEERFEAKRKAEERAARGGTANALVTIDDVAKREEIANYDWQYGEGAWARKEAAMAEYMERARRASAEFEVWKRENPELWAAQEAERQAEAEKARKREERLAKRRKGPGPRKIDPKYNSDAYWSGREEGAKVRLDRQVEGTKIAGELA